MRLVSIVGVIVEANGPDEAKAAFMRAVDAGSDHAHILYSEGGAQLRAQLQGVRTLARLDLDMLADESRPSALAKRLTISRCASTPRPDLPGLSAGRRQSVAFF
jgi:hypothetical protein